MKKRPSILITGGAGYIGSHCCKALYKLGFLPITFDNLSTGHKKFVKWGPLIVGDLLEQEKLKTLFLEKNPIAVMHFAANASVEESMKDPIKYYYNNILSTLSLIKEMISSKVNLLIFSSSCSIFGTPKTISIKETTKKNPISSYAKSKLIIENMLKDFEKAYNIKYISLRYFNAAGADTSSEIGEKHENETHLIPLAIQAALGKKELNVYGTNYSTKDGSAIRDFVHVEDIVKAHIKALFYLLTKEKTEEINIGSGKGFSVLQIVKNIEKHTKKKIKIKIKEKRKGDPEALFCDNKKAKKILNWKPEKDIEDIISSAFNWHKKEAL